jgi:micrococcal nuclease
MRKGEARRLRRLILLAAAVVVVLLTGGGALRLGDEAAPETRTAQVIRVVDGDTILVLLDGVRERVRYIGIDTPESVAEQPLECYGHRAADENERLVGGRTVTLTTDEEPRDRFGRLLAYVRREPDDLFVNEALVRGGFATTLEIRPNVRYAGTFRDEERKARGAGRGLWGACAR